MKVFRLDGTGRIDGLYRDEADVPKPRSRQVLVRVGAASLNYLDLKILDGRFAVGPRKGLIPLSDGAGEVVALGEDVNRWKIGSRVAGTFLPRWIAGPMPEDGRSDLPGATRDGMLAEFVLADQEALVEVPRHLDYIEASTLPCAGLTAWVVLFDGARPLLPGETVLTHGSGGVSVFAIQFAKLAGARVIVTTSNERKAQRLRELGADHTIDRSEIPDWASAVMKITEGRGADHLFESSGTLPQSLAASGVGAQLSLLGVPENTQIDPLLLMKPVITLRRISIGSRAAFETMNKAINYHGLRPVVGRVFAFDDAPAAYEHLESGAHFGKVVISMG